MAEITKFPNDEDLESEQNRLEGELKELRKRIEIASATPSISTESVNKIKMLSTSINNESQKRLKLVCKFKYQHIHFYVNGFTNTFEVQKFS